MAIHPIEGRLKHELQDLVNQALPHEAVGLIFPDGWVISLTNHADDDSSFSVSRTEMLEVITKYWPSGDPTDVVLWHSHPGGGIGPSRYDMQQRTPLLNHLVLSLVDGDLIPTWY